MSAKDEKKLTTVSAFSCSLSFLGRSWRSRMQLMSSEEAYRLSQARHSDPVDVSVAEDLVGELEGHLSNLSPTVRTTVMNAFGT